MKHQNQLSKFFMLLVILAMSICTTTLHAQSDATKTMTIKVVAVDQDGNQTTRTIVKQGDEVVEENIQAEIDALLEEMNAGDLELNVDVNVEIEDGNGDGNEMVEGERTITIDMEGDEAQMTIIDTDTETLDDATRQKLEEALEGTDIDLDEILNGKFEDENGERSVRIIKKQMDTPTNKAFLGVYVNANSNSNAKGTYAIVSDIVKDSAAEKAGLKAGDQINSIDGTTISNFKTLVELLSKYEPGDVVKINYTRADETKTTTATLTGPKQNKMNTWKSANGEEHNLNGRKYKFKEGKSCQKGSAKSGCCKGNSTCDPNDPSTWPAGCCPDGKVPAGCCSKKANNDKARLGVYLENGDFDGAKVSEVIKGSVAEKAGMKDGAIIKKVGKTKINNEEELIDAIQNYKIGDEVKIHWVNGSSKNKKKVVFTKAKRKSGSCCSGGNSPNKITEKKIIIRKKKLDNGNEVVEEIIEDDNLPSFLNLNTIELFPNPTDGKITVKFTINNKEATTVELIDVTGKKVFSEINPDFDGSYSKEIDLTGNPEGIYILSISQNDKTFTEKIIFNKQ